MSEQPLFKMALDKHATTAIVVGAVVMVLGLGSLAVVARHISERAASERVKLCIECGMSCACDGGAP